MTVKHTVSVRNAYEYSFVFIEEEKIKTKVNRVWFFPAISIIISTNVF